MRVALFAPCFVDQLYPNVAIATLKLLERLGIEVHVPSGAVCCGQPPANAGFAKAGDAALERFVHTFESYDRVVVISGSCALHVRNHAGTIKSTGARVASATMELCQFLHDDIGIGRLAALGATTTKRVGVHIGCHGLRGLGLAKPTELQDPPFDKVKAILGAIHGVTFVDLERRDECCGFGGTFSVDEPAVSTKMGVDRLRDYSASGADVIVSTDPSCMMHLSGLSRARAEKVPFQYVAEFLDGALAS